jgi:hypothetical protein
MKITNKLNLPQPLVAAVTNDGYSKGDADISVTELLSPPRQTALKKLHSDEIEEDASERIFSLLGQVIHGILERATTEGVAERRLSIEVGGWTVSGGMDLYNEGGILSDYKFVTAYKFKGGVAPKEYEEQLNCYAEILRSNQHPVTCLQIVAILRDWSKLEAARDPEYPQTQVIIVPVPLWEPERARRFISDRVVLHQQARLTLPLCSHDDRWAKPDTFAVTKQGAKRASRVYENEDEAVAHAAQDAKLFVSKRPGSNTRCEHYCAVAKYCTQFHALDADARAEWLTPDALGQGIAG